LNTVEISHSSHHLSKSFTIIENFLFSNIDYLPITGYHAIAMQNKLPPNLKTKDFSKERDFFMTHNSLSEEYFKYLMNRNLIKIMMNLNKKYCYACQGIGHSYK